MSGQGAGRRSTNLRPPIEEPPEIAFRHGIPVGLPGERIVEQGVIGREGNAMLIGKPEAATTAISAASSDRVTVRGRDLAHDLMGARRFTDYVFLLATGRTPTEEQRFFLDLSLVALAEHGLTPSVQAARMTYDADPAALQGAIAAGVLGCGTVILGAADLCRKVIEDVLARADACGSLDAAALESRANIARSASRSPATAIRCISPSIRAPSA